LPSLGACADAPAGIGFAGVRPLVARAEDRKEAAMVGLLHSDEIEEVLHRHHIGHLACLTAEGRDLRVVDIPPALAQQLRPLFFPE
jgi:hypothetical protein